MNINFKIKYFIIFLILVLIYSVTNAQTIDEQIQRIGLKLSKDADYLNLNYLVYHPDKSDNVLLNDIPRANKRKPFSFKINDDIEYRIIFLNGGIGLDSINILYVDEVKLNTLSGKNFFVNESITDDTLHVLSFKDIYYLKLFQKNYYNKLYTIVSDYILQNEGVPLPSLLKINPDKNINTSLGMSSRDNTDYYNYEKINSPHWYPSNEKIIVTGRSSAKLHSDSRYDISFSRISFSHKFMDFSIGTAGIEFRTTEHVLNLLPLESATISAGFRTVFMLNNKSDKMKSTYLDSRIFARINLNSKDIFQNQPYAISDGAKLNLGNAIIGEFTFTKPFNLPFINIYFASGAVNYQSPTYFTSVSTKLKEAYFSFNQFEFSMSFYWNSSDKMISRFRFDVGAAYYDIWKATYYPDGIFQNAQQVQNKFLPMLKISYNFVPSHKPLLGGNIKIFDSRINLLAWFKLFQFSNNDSFRFETIVISKPFMRTQRKWESNGGLFFQLRFRHGLL